MLIETKPPSLYPRWDVCLRAVVVAFVLRAMQMEHLALSCGEEPHTKACWEENTCSFTPSWLDILPSDWLCACSSHSPPSTGFLSLHESRNIWKLLQCETTRSSWRWHEFKSGFVIATTSHELPWVLTKPFHASSNRNKEERVPFLSPSICITGSTCFHTFLLYF